MEMEPYCILLSLTLAGSFLLALHSRLTVRSSSLEPNIQTWYGVNGRILGGQFYLLPLTGGKKQQEVNCQPFQTLKFVSPIRRMAR